MLATHSLMRGTPSAFPALRLQLEALPSSILLVRQGLDMLAVNDQR